MNTKAASTLTLSTQVWRFALALLLTTCFTPAASVAATITLDPSFAAGNVAVITDLSGATDGATAITVQSDGKIVVVGACANFSRLCIARYLENGALDTAGFNAADVASARGKRVLPQPTTVGLSTNVNSATSVAALANGKILIGGYCADLPCAMQLLPDGSTDSAFGTNGILYVNASSTLSGRVEAVIQKNDGRIVLSGTCGGRMCVLQLLPDGTPDTNFGTAGLRVLNPTQPSGLFVQTIQYMRAISVQSDGKLVVWGECETRSGAPNNVSITTTGCAQRLAANGSTDTTFGVAGAEWRSYTLGSNGGTIYSASGPMPDGQTVIAAACYTGNASYRPCLLRVLADGSLDPTFSNGLPGTYSYAATALSGAGGQNVAAAAVLPDGKIFVAVTCLFGGANQDWQFCVARHNTDGSFDATFDNDGAIGHTVGSGGSFARAVALQPDGKLLVAGNCVGAGSVDFCVSRYLPGANYARNCTMDLDGDGKVLATTDMLMSTRVSLGLTGSAVTNGITFSNTATRNTWPLIREYLISHCAMKLP